MIDDEVDSVHKEREEKEARERKREAEREKEREKQRKKHEREVLIRKLYNIIHFILVTQKRAQQNFKIIIFFINI